MTNITRIDILNASNEKLLEISKNGLLSLNLDEMQVIQRYYKKLHRNPTDIELETIAQTWSEHCNHKSLKGIINYDGKIIDNLLKNTIIKVTKELNKKWCVSVFKDNAGIIKFDDKFNVVFKVETHNHPSAIEPYGGAGTGIGGVIRDVLGVGLGAKPILNTDIFCFASPDFSNNKVPEGVLHPKRIFKGVVSGVRDYGNRMGIPTANGAICFDDGYLCNPLVYCGTVGLIPKNKSFKKVKPGDLIIAIGGRTGRDGIHGATFSSAELVKNISASVVQIGNPIVEKKVTDVLLKARDENLYNAVTDCGAGGFSSAVGEMGLECGANVSLEKVTLKYKGLLPWEIWVSEAQERMVFSVPKNKLKRFEEICKEENVELTCIGKFTSDKKLKVQYKGKMLVDIDMKFLHDGVPRVRINATLKTPDFVEPIFEDSENLTASLHKVLSNYNIASKEWIIRQYDHEVQGGSILKPLQGVQNDGPGDACIVRPILSKWTGVIVANGVNPQYGKIDAYHMSASAIDEALRNITAVGGNINNTAILDNFCWGDPTKPEQMGDLVRASFACYDIAKVYQTPFISGKDSLNNEYFNTELNKRVSIPPTLLISAICVMKDVRKAVSMDVKSAGNLIYIVGTTYNELGGSRYYESKGFIGNNVPVVRPEMGKKIMSNLHEAITGGFVRACHDCSEGGLAVALSEMAFAGGLGMKIYLKKVPVNNVSRNDTILFSEANSRFIVEVSPTHQKDFERTMKNISLAIIGKVTRDKKLEVFGINNKKVISADIYALKESWQKPLRW
ncbi:MAG: phosphoribosylformylglycinamidine synthase subunit PurL [Candidatus Firestonebacteria bacterium]